MAIFKFSDNQGRGPRAAATGQIKLGRFLGRALRLGPARGPITTATCLKFKTPPAASLYAGIPPILFFWICKIQTPSLCFGILRGMCVQQKMVNPYIIYGSCIKKLRAIAESNFKKERDQYIFQGQVETLSEPSAAAKTGLSLSCISTRHARSSLGLPPILFIIHNPPYFLCSWMSDMNMCFQQIKRSSPKSTPAHCGSKLSKVRVFQLKDE